MGGLVDFIFGSDDAEEATIAAANVSAASQTEALNYLKEREEIPQFLREESLQKLGGLYGMNDQGGQQDLINQSIESPLYKTLMGGQEMGEEAIMRNAGMTGNLRSGNVQGNMYDYVTQLQNQALLASYNEQLGGLRGLAGLSSNANQIAGGMSNIGMTKAQGISGGAQAGAAGNQQVMNNLLGIGGLAAMFSDRRLKKNIKLLGTVNDYNFYSFDWNRIGNELGLVGSTCGCMADEVFKKYPNAVFLKDDFMMVNYSEIGVL